VHRVVQMLRFVVVPVVLVVLVLVLLGEVGVREVGDVRRRSMTYAAKQAGLAASRQECRRFREKSRDRLRRVRRLTAPDPVPGSRVLPQGGGQSRGFPPVWAAGEALARRSSGCQGSSAPRAGDPDGSFRGPFRAREKSCPGSGLAPRRAVCLPLAAFRPEGTPDDPPPNHPRTRRHPRSPAPLGLVAGGFGGRSPRIPELAPVRPRTAVGRGTAVRGSVRPVERRTGPWRTLGPRTAVGAVREASGPLPRRVVRSCRRRAETWAPSRAHA
jgi:hypothetical protein